jgi:hypothetical protein
MIVCFLISCIVLSTPVCFAEMILKVFASRGLWKYLSNSSNLFDMAVVVASLPTLVELMMGDYSDGSSSKFKSVAVFRMFRVFRVARLLHKVKSMRRMLSTVFSSVTSILHLSIFIGFTLVTASILSTALFSRPYPPSVNVANAVNSAGFNIYAGGASPKFHFDTFPDSIVSMFIITTGGFAFQVLVCDALRMSRCLFALILVSQLRDGVTDSLPPPSPSCFNGRPKLD